MNKNKNSLRCQKLIVKRNVKDVLKITKGLIKRYKNLTVEEYKKK